jgi:hypothetical protein
MTTRQRQNPHQEELEREELIMGWGLGIIGIIIWIAIAFWPARVAGRKGHSFIGYFCLSLLFFPLALIMAYLVGDRVVPLATP